MFWIISATCLIGMFFLGPQFLGIFVAIYWALYFLYKSAESFKGFFANAAKSYRQLRSEIEKKDPDYFTTGEMENPQRMMRALEVKLSTGRSIRSFQSKEKKQRNFNIITIGLELPRDILYERINARVDTMMEMGLLKEAKALLPYKHLNALQTVGYRELFDHFDGKITVERAIELIKQNTRHFAKRQLTWFKRDGSITWLAPDIQIVLNHVLI